MGTIRVDADINLDTLQDQVGVNRQAANTNAQDIQEIGGILSQLEARVSALEEGGVEPPAPVQVNVLFDQAETTVTLTSQDDPSFALTLTEDTVIFLAPGEYLWAASAPGHEDQSGGLDVFPDSGPFDFVVSLFPIPDPDPEPPPDNLPTLVDRWWWRQPIADPPLAETEGVKYFARALVPGFDFNQLDNLDAYAVQNLPVQWLGADVLIGIKEYRHTEGRVLMRNNNAGMYFRLTRPATVGILRFGGNEPNRPVGWEFVDIQQIDTTRGEKDLFVYRAPAGDHIVGGGPSYFDLWFLEENGVATPDPTPPSGLIAPTPNTVIPRDHWLHDGSLSHLAPGPDGVAYNTWHPQFDPVYAVWYGHEHGSDPALFPAFGDAGWSFNENGMVQSHPVYPLWNYSSGGTEVLSGFKVLTWHSPVSDLYFMSTIHKMTSDRNRVCRQYYTRDFAVAREDGQVLLHLHGMANMGRSRLFDPDNRLGTGQRFIFYRPNDCLDNPTRTGGLRNINAGFNAYESWEGWGLGPLLQRHIIGTQAIVTDNPMTQSDGELYTVNGVQYLRGENFVENPHTIYESNTGSRRWFIIPDAEGTGLGVNTLNMQTGFFYTDRLGQQFLQPGEPGALRQYVQGGVDERFHVPGHWQVDNPFDADYVTDTSFNELGFWRPFNRVWRIERDIGMAITAPN